MSLIKLFLDKKKRASLIDIWIKKVRTKINGYFHNLHCRYQCTIL